MGRPWRSWPAHNLVAHPVGEALHIAGVMISTAGRVATIVGETLAATDGLLHDATLPAHEPGTGRG